MAFPAVKISQAAFLGLFGKLREHLHQANSERQTILSIFSLVACGIEKLKFYQTEFEQNLNPTNFILNLEYHSQDCHRRLEDYIQELNQ